MLARQDGTPRSLETCSAVSVILATWYRRAGKPRRAQIVLGRAQRTLMGAANVNLELAAEHLAKVSIGGPTAPAPATLDSAVALLELAGHPHILGREAFAILDGTGCCAQLALLTVGPTIARAVAVAGWTEAEAVTALASAKPEEITLLGPHRDDSWQLLVRPGPDLDDHCTVAAVRQLVDIARTLDRYRRDEQERNALWPAESLDGDPESIWISEQSIELLSNARRIASNPSPVLHHRRDRHRQGDARARDPSRLRSRRAATPCRSTAARCRATCSRASCSATSAARSPAPTPPRRE